MTRVVCAGIAVLDLVFEVATMPTTAGKHFAHALHQVAGGPAANGAVTVARLGGSAALIGVVGDDAAGEVILSQLAADGVDVSGVGVVDGATSPTSAVVVDAAGERMIVNHLDPQLALAGSAPATPIADADAVLVDVRLPTLAEGALRAAAVRGCPAVLDYDLTVDLDDTALLRRATHIAFAASALATRAGTDDPAEGLRRIARETDAWLAVTLGADGVVWLDGDRVVQRPAFAVEVVETLGAGDVFHGALALHLGAGVGEARAVELASAAAALKCTRAGGRAGIPSAADVDAFLARTGD